MPLHTNLFASTQHTHSFPSENGKRRQLYHPDVLNGLFVSSGEHDDKMR